MIVFTGLTGSFVTKEDLYQFIDEGKQDEAGAKIKFRAWAKVQITRN